MKSIVLILLMWANCRYSQAQETRQSIKITDSQVHAIDSMINATYKADEPGAAVLLAQDGKILLRKGYGMANMELQVSVNPSHVFGIGTLSIYFTAVAILILQEQGKLDVKDDIRKYIPGYNTYGKTITIENLLTHTCGIPGFREYVAYSVKDKLEESRYAGLHIVARVCYYKCCSYCRQHRCFLFLYKIYFLSFSVIKSGHHGTTSNK